MTIVGPLNNIAVRQQKIRTVWVICIDDVYAAVNPQRHPVWAMT